MSPSGIPFRREGDTEYPGSAHDHGTFGRGGEEGEKPGRDA